ncbi:recombinase family protein [Sorangium sp. So ce302]|uniref:recombinase family protein n=1 Tax=Sorangium sp. So ce302 TaxID=3133297 RepID=UPI003F5D69DB
MKKVALYARVSSDRQTRQATVDSQVAALKERALADGHHVLPADVHVDDGCSGATLIRPALERLRDRIAEGVVDVLYVHSPDRLARRYAYQVLLLEEFSARGVSIVFLQGASGVNAEDQLLVQVQGMLAEYERARLAERCRRGKLHRARQGMVNPLSTAPYGYRYVRRSDAEPAHYEIVRSEANVVRAIFDAFVHQQTPLRTIARRLNTQQIPTPRGGCWRGSRLHELLRNPAYMGQAAYGKRESVESRPLRPRRSKPRIARGGARTHRRRPADQWISIPVPPIVSAEVFTAAGEQMMRNKQLSQRHARGQRYLLQGLVVCARCGYAFCGRSASKPSSSVIYRYYSCTSVQAVRHGTARACNNPSVRAEMLDAQVWDSVRQVLQEPERLEEEWLRRSAADGAAADAQLERAQAERWVVHHQRSLKRLLDAYEAGAICLEELLPRAERLREQIRRAEQAVKEAEDRLSQNAVLSAVVTRLQDFAERVGRGLEHLDWQGRRQLIRTLVARVEIDEEQATVVYRLPSSGGRPGGGHVDPSAPSSSSAGSPGCRLSPWRQSVASAPKLASPTEASLRISREGERRFGALATL